MSKLTLPGLARKGRDLRAEAAIPCTTGRQIATHLTSDRHREPSFDDLVAGNDREPSHEDLLAADEPTEQPRPKAYPGVADDALAWLRAQDVDDQLPAAAAAATEWLRAHDAADKQPPTPAAAADDEPPAPPAIEEPPTVPVGDPRLLFDALDALDQLPELYIVDAAAFEMAASVAAIQTYVALRPELLHTTGLSADLLALELSEIAALLDQPLPAPMAQAAHDTESEA